MDGLSVSRDETSATIAAIVEEVDVDLPLPRDQTSPDGMMTIVFTDVQGSTEMLERLGEDEWFQMMLRHNSLVRTAVSDHGGSVVKSQGDGFMIVFSSTNAALRFAVALQREIAGHNPGSAEEPLLLRIGMHTGNVMRADEDYLGKAVVLAARITGHASGGEILVSATSWQYTEHLGLWSYDQRGELQLKGLATPEQVYSLDWG